MYQTRGYVVDTPKNICIFDIYKLCRCIIGGRGMTSQFCILFKKYFMLQWCHVYNGGIRLASGALCSPVVRALAHGVMLFLVPASAPRLV